MFDGNTIPALEKSSAMKNDSRELPRKFTVPKLVGDPTSVPVPCPRSPEVPDAMDVVDENTSMVQVPPEGNPDSSPALPTPWIVSTSQDDPEVGVGANVPVRV